MGDGGDFLNDHYSTNEHVYRSSEVYMYIRTYRKRVVKMDVLHICKTLWYQEIGRIIKGEQTGLLHKSVFSLSSFLLMPNILKCNENFHRWVLCYKITNLNYLLLRNWMCIHIFIITRTREMIEFRHFWGHDHYDIVFNQNQLFSELTLRNMRLHCNSSPSSIRSGSGGLQHPCDWYCNKILKHNLLDNDFQYCTKRHLALVTLKMI